MLPCILHVCYPKPSGAERIFFHGSGRKEKRHSSRRIRALNIMEWSSLELKVISCNDLKAFNFFQKLSVYAVVSIINGELKKKDQQQKCMQRQKIPIDREGGMNPEWNHALQFDLKALVGDYSHLLLCFDLHCEGVVYGNRTIGKVRVPLQDLIDESNGALRFVRYQVRTSDGKPNGVLNFSFKVNGKNISNGGTVSPEVQSSPKIPYSSEKVHYPSLEDDEQSQDMISYPPLDYIHSPLPGYCSPLPKYEYKAAATEVYGMDPPVRLPPQLPPLVVASGSYYPSPFIQTPGSWYMLETTGYGYNMRGGGPGFVQFRDG